ncbi:MAG: polyphosphate kinase 2 family protein [Pseudolabrys sp.]|nr:polyphosphate kinase 2 family protein [Pseudolabrys sp.]
MKFADIAKRVRVDKPDKFKLADCDPKDTCGLDIDKSDANDFLADGQKRLADLQDKLYAQNRWAVLAVLQGMDAAGKDGVISHVLASINPQGCEVHPFKQPGPEELAHDFLWRANKRLPERGRIGIFNRSYYEEVIVVRVHPEFLDKQNLPDDVNGKDIWQRRFDSIRHFERHLVRNGISVLKFFLNVSREEQRKRFLDRIEQPNKRWKFSMNDVRERGLWDKYMAAYDEAICSTSSDEAPWHVIPADRKWFSRLAVASVMVEAMERLDLAFPRVEGAALDELKKAKAALEAEK